VSERERERHNERKSERGDERDLEMLPSPTPSLECKLEKNYSYEVRKELFL
jgi:hypothetical protein